MHQRFKVWLIFVLLGNALCASDIITIPGIVRTVDNPVYPISIESNDEKISVLARRAFGVHGAYRVVANDSGKVKVRIDRLSSNQVNLIIQSGETNQTLAQGRISGSDWMNATLLACDQVVERTSGLKGFFAGRLAFVGERTGDKEIFVGDLFFQRFRALTQDRSESVSPRWSPDGKRIVYTGYFRSGFPEIYMLDVENRTRSTVARFRGTNTGGTFSPDGRRLAMVLSSPGNPEIYLADAQGNRPRRMTMNATLEASPSFSPDGRRLVLTSDPMGFPQIYMLTLDGPSRNNSGMQRIARSLSRNCSEPVWNPVNPDLIAFTVLQGSGFQIAVYDISTATSTVLTSGGSDSVEPAWTSDGRHLIYTLRAAGRKQLRVLDTVTKKSVGLHSPNAGNASQASFIYP